MSLTTEQKETLQGLAQPHLCEVVAVYLDGPDADPTYYAKADYAEFINFRLIPLTPIVPRLMSGFHPIPLFPDINSQPVEFTFADSDQTLRAIFTDKDYVPIKVEIYYYWADIDEIVLMWEGHLKRPEIVGIYSQTVKGVTGYRSPEMRIPSEIRMKECSARVFGGNLETLLDVERSLCPYDLHLGGSQGVNNPDTSAPWTSCPRLTKDDCSARFGHSRYFGSYDFEAPGVNVNSRFITSKGKSNDSLLRTPISIIWGAKILLKLPVLQYYSRQDTSNANRGTVHVLAEVSNDECESVFNVFYNIFSSSGSAANVQSYQVRLGQRGQSATGWTPGVSNFSGRTYVYVVGTSSSNPGTTAGVNNIEITCYCHGFKNGRIYSDAETYAKARNNHRVWAVLEFLTNIRWGAGYPHTKFDIQSFIDVHDWAITPVQFTLDLESGSKTWNLTPRTIFDCNTQALPAAEQITNICRTGRFSVPFFADGVYKVVPLSKATEEELTNAPIFTDAIGGNIIRSATESSLKFSQVDVTDLKNTIVVTFEDADNNDVSRPVTCRDPNQQALAGRILGSGGFIEQKASFIAYGVRRLEEAIKYGYSLLWFGEFDRGGTRNNLKAVFTVTLRQALSFTKYQIIKIVSTQNTFESPEGHPFQYFRVIDAVLNQNLSVSVITQAYNEYAYETFEIEITEALDPPSELSTVDDFTPKPIPEALAVTASYSDGYITVEVS